METLKRDRLFAFRVNRKEQQLIKDLATLEGRTLSSTVRAAIKERARRLVCEIAEKDEGQRDNQK